MHVISYKALELSGIKKEYIGKEIAGKEVKVDLDRQILKPLCGTHTMFCYDSPEYVKDMGTPERYNSVCDDFKRGVVQAKNLKNKQKAFFLIVMGQSIITLVSYVILMIFFLLPMLLRQLSISMLQVILLL